MFFGYKRFHIVTDMLLLAELLTVASLSRIAHERYVAEIRDFFAAVAAPQAVSKEADRIVLA